MAFSFQPRQARRLFLVAIATSVLALAGCQRGEPYRPVAPGPVEPGLPSQAIRHHIALIIPLTGPDGGVGTSIMNAANLALLDTNAGDLRLTTFDSSQIGAAAAAERAIASGAGLILGPLLADDVRAVAPIARRARVPVIAFSNDAGVAGNGVYILGITPAQSIDRVVRLTRAQGTRRYGALIPTGLYGQRATQALIGSLRASQGTLVAMQPFDRSPAAARSAAQTLNARGDYDAVMIADTGRIAASAAPAVEAGPKLIGTELWAHDRELGQVRRLRGALYAAAPDARFAQLVTRYRARYGKTPYRLGSLGYDAVLLTVRAARSWPARSRFPIKALQDADGFAGVDGIFRFGRDGTAQRALEVRQVTATGSMTVSPAPSGFDN
jgi:branched-chain amino acid transport system substrate-binding protein